MPRQPPLPKRPARSRLQAVISGDLHQRVDLYCAHYGITEGRFFETAAREKLDGSGDGKALARQLKELNEQLAILSEHSHLFVQMWLKNTQLFTKEEQRAARPQATALYERFVRQIQMNLTGGEGFLGECRQRLREAPPADDAAPRSSTQPSASKKTEAKTPRHGAGAPETRAAGAATLTRARAAGAHSAATRTNS